MHGIHPTPFTVLTAALIAWALVSRRAERFNVSMPIALMTLGVGARAMGWVEVELSDSTVLTVAEVTLALVLFSDAARIELDRLRRDRAIALRLLLVGLPITIALGALFAHLLIPGIGLALAAVIGAAVAPTDAALGAAIVEDERVPAFVRRMLSTESGLNDGIATPFVVGALAIGAEMLGHETGGHRVGALGALFEIALGAAVGVGAGLLGSFLLRTARRTGWAHERFVPVAVSALALLTYSVATELGGNGFIAAFVGGIAFGVRPLPAPRSLDLPVDITNILGGLLWFLFGGVLSQVWSSLGWREFCFAAAALTVVRMLPVAASLVGSGLDRGTVLFVGWAGPRGLASLVFSLLAVESLGATDAQPVVQAVVLTVAASVVAHGVSAAPLARRFGRRERRSPYAAPPA